LISQQYSELIDNKTKILYQILSKITLFNNNQIQNFIPTFYNLFCELIESDSKQIRYNAKQILIRIGNMLIDYSEKLELTLFNNAE